MREKVLTSEQLNALRKEIYSNAVAHGFHDEKLTVEHFLGLVLSEIGEAINADRNPNAPTVTEATLEQAQLLADQSIGHVAFVEFFKSNIKGSVIEELADVAIRILDLAGMLGITFQDDLEVDDLVFNTTFPDRLFDFALSLDSLDLEFTDEDDFLECLEEITSIAMRFTNLNLWKVVGLKMIYNNTRPMLNGKKY